MTGGTVPRYEDLPLLDGTGARHAWDVWGRGDSLGSVNRLSPERVRHAARCVRQGKVINLDLPLDQPDPGTRPPFTYSVETTRTGRDDHVSRLHLQRSSQIDGLGHMRSRTGQYWGGRDDAAVDAGEIGIGHWTRHGIVGRGVLIDVERHSHCVEPAGDYGPRARVGVTARNIVDIAEAEGVGLDGTDFVVLHTGWLGSFLADTPDARRRMLEEQLPAGRLPMPGFDAGVETTAWLWDHGVVGLLADNLAVEALPVRRPDGFAHRSWIALLGMVLGELIDTAILAEDCRQDGQYDFLLSLSPLHIPVAVGSPANAYVVK